MWPYFSGSSLAPTTRKINPPPPPPTPDQVAALGVLKDEVDAYEKGAKDYRDTVTTIIRLHYESKKKEVLSGLDREIAIEKAELKKANEAANKATPVITLESVLDGDTKSWTAEQDLLADGPTDTHFVAEIARRSSRSIGRTSSASNA